MVDLKTPTLPLEINWADYLGKLKACMVDINDNLGVMRFQFDIYECPLDTYCKPFGKTGLATMLGYVQWVWTKFLLMW